MTEVAAHDQGFVAAPPAEVFGVLADLPSYGTWWLGLEARVEGEDVRLRARRWGDASVRAEGHRPGVGLFLRLSGTGGGTLEWYLEPFEEGTIVNAIVHLEVPGGPGRANRRLRRVRAAVHRGLTGLRVRMGRREEPLPLTGGQG